MQLASGQDAKTWNARVRRRQTLYAEPMVLRPFIDRLIAMGVLPPAQEGGYDVSWADLNTLTDMERADIADKITTALAKYVAGDVEQIIPIAEYLSMVHGLTADEVEQIISALESMQMDVDPADDTDIEPVTE